MSLTGAIRRTATRSSGRPASAIRIPSPDPSALSWASSPAVRGRMQAQRTRDTAPELALRRLLHARGLRYRIDSPPLPGLRRRADLVFGPARVAVFVDGCFWHGCPEHGTRPTLSNPEYWSEKIAGNTRRDRDTDRELAARGWLPFRIWEHESMEEAAERVAAAVEWRRHAKRTDR